MPMPSSLPSHPPYRVLGVGAACMDLLIPVEEAFLSHVPGKKGGAQPIDLEELNRIIALSGKIPQLTTGGSCANTIKGLACLGEKCAFLSYVGQDPLGEHFSAYLHKLGIVDLLFPSSLPTARVLCLITPDGQRTMRFFAGSSQEMAAFTPHLNHLQGVRHIHVDAYSLSNGKLVHRLMQKAQKAKSTISIDLSSFEIVKKYEQPLRHMLAHYVDIVFANKDEAQALTGLPPDEGCFKLQKICSIAVVLMGKEGCLVGHRGRVFSSPARPTQVVDSTGAGDLFGSGFLYGYLRHYSLEACAQLGNRLGSAVVEVQGAELSQERWQQLRATIEADQQNNTPT